MRYTRLYTAILLLGVMLVNICKYQLPYIEYNIFREYIVENLCINRFEANNECQGKCFLNKEIDRINESDNNAGNTTSEEKQITFEIDDCIIDSLENKQYFGSKVPATFFIDAIYITITLDIPTPPPERFI